MRRVLFALITGLAACGISDFARAQTTQPAQPAPKAAPKVAKPEATKPDATKPDVTRPDAKTAAKPESKPAAALPAAIAGGAEPALIGQFGIWGAYSATPNGKKVCFALAKPSASK